MGRKRQARAVGLMAGFLVLATLACLGGAGEGLGGPVIAITSPTDNSSVAMGEEVEVETASVAEAGVARVELSVNGQMVSSDYPPEGSPDTYASTLVWTPMVEGTATISVVVFDVNEVASEATSITLQVVAADVESEATPATQTEEEEESCSNEAEFVTHVTIPDMTTMTPASAFTKVWRVRNTGSCAWSPEYHLVFVSGDHMSGPASVSLTAVAAGASTDVGVNLTAPAAPGTYVGTWRILADEGIAFGPELRVTIVVPAAPTATSPPATATHTSTPEPSATPGATLVFPIITLVPIFPPESQQVLNQVSVGGNNIGQAVVSCPAGSVVTGGGYATSDDLFVYTHLKSGNGWQVYAKNNSASSKLLNAYAICLSNTGGSTSQVSEQVSAAAGGIGHAVAACPAGTVVTGGGYASKSDGSLLVYNSSRSGNGWEVYAQNSSGSSQLLNAYAICLADVSGTTSEVVKQETVGGNSAGSSTAECPSGSLVTGGGFAGSVNVWVYNTSRSGDGWITYADNLTGSGQLLNSYATCLSFP